MVELERRFGIVTETPHSLPQGINYFEKRKLGTATASNGRLIRERLGPSDPIIPSPFRGSREGTSMSKLALAEVGKSWPRMVDGFAFVHHKQLGEKDTDVTIGELKALCETGLGLPTYGFLRAELPYSPAGELPVEVSAAYKAFTGYHVAAREILERYKLPSHTIVTPEQVYDYAEKSRRLRTRNESCVATPHMMVSGLQALMYGKGGDFDKSNFATYFPDFNAAIIYGFLRARTEDFIEEWTDHTVPHILSQVTRMTEHGDKQGAQETIASYLSHESTLLIRTNTLQFEMNRVLGRNPLNAPPITVRHLENELGNHSPRTLIP